MKCARGSVQFARVLVAGLRVWETTRTTVTHPGQEEDGGRGGGREMRTVRNVGGGLRGCTTKGRALGGPALPPPPGSLSGTSLSSFSLGCSLWGSSCAPVF